MIEIEGMHHIGIRVRNLEVARDFYARLGFEFLAGPIGPEPVAIIRHPSGVCINFILNADAKLSENILMDVPEKYPGLTHFALRVSDIRSVENFIQSLNIPITEGPLRLPDGGWMFFIRDPDKNVIEFHQDG